VPDLRPRHEAALLLLVLAAVLALTFPEVVFGGRTLTTAVNNPSIYPTGFTTTPMERRNVADAGGSAWVDEPYHRITGRAFAEGEVPHWNPGSGCGAPFLANQLSAPFYPLNVLLHVLPGSIGEDVFLLARLLVAGWFTWLFLRLFEVSRPAALVGAAGFMLSGPLILHVNILNTNADVLHPAMLYAIERFVRRGQCTLVVLVTAAALLSGMPEPGFFVVLLGGLWLLFRAAGSGRFLPLVARHAFLSTAALCLSAPFLLPFAELLGRAAHFHDDGATGRIAWPLRTAILLLDPAFFRAGPSKLSLLDFPSAAATPYVGLALPFLALLALPGGGGPFARARLPLAGFALFYLLKAYGAPIVNEVGRLPILRLCLFPKFLLPPFAFALSALAAHGADALAARRVGARGAALAALAVLAPVALWTALYPPGRTIALWWSPDAHGGVLWPAGLFAVLAGTLLLARRAVPPAWAALALVLIELIVYVPRSRPPRLEPPSDAPYLEAIRRDGGGVPGQGRVFGAGGVLLPNWGAALGLEDVRWLDAVSVAHYHDFVRALVTPAVSKDKFMGVGRPFPDPLARWSRFLGVRWIASHEPLPGLAGRFLDEGLRFTDGRGGLAGEGGDGLRLTAPGEARLDLELPDRGTTLAFDEVRGALEIVERAPARPAVAHLEELREGGPRRVDLAAWRGQDVTLTFALGPGPHDDRAHDRIRLAGLRLGGEPPDLESAARGAEEAGTLVIAPDALEATPVAIVEVSVRVPAGSPELTFSAEPREPGLGDGVHLSVLVTAPRAGERLLWRNSSHPTTRRVPIEPGPRKVTLILRARDTAGAMTSVENLRLEPALLTLLHDAGPWVYRNEAALPRAQVVHRAEFAASDEAGLARLAEDDFDPAKTVLLHAEMVPGTISEMVPGTISSHARVTGHRRHEVVVEAESSAPGWLVLADTFYPGWRADVDGRPAEVLRANHAFRAVHLPAGRHEVRFRYVSVWFRVGLALAGVGALALAAAALIRRAGGRLAARKGQV